MKIDEIQSALQDERLDGWLFFDHHHRDPLSYAILGLREDVHVSRRWYYFIPVSGEPRGLVHRIESHVLDALSGGIKQYSTWSEQKSGLQSLLRDAETVAMQFSEMCAVPYVAMVDGGTIDLVRSLGVKVRTSANLVQLFQARWSSEQLDGHLECGRRMDRIRAEAFDFIQDRLRSNERVTEWAAAEFIRSRIGQEELFTDHGPIVAVNANASDPHYEPTAERTAEIRQSDVILIDMWAKLNQPAAVYYDITWTGYAGAAPPNSVLNVFRLVTSARDRGIEIVKDRAGTGLQGFEVDDAVRCHIAESGFGEYFVHRTGHSIGTEVHGSGANMDNFETHDERKIIPGTCFSIEPGVYLPDFGIRSEVNVYVGTNSARVTGQIQDALVLLT